MENSKNSQNQGLNQNLNLTPLIQERAVSFFKKKAAQILVACLVAGLLATGILATYFYTRSVDLRNNPQKITQEENSALIASIGKLILLPSGEQPTIATVTDPERLKEQAFFANAKKGDKVLIYTNARKAILYNPTSNKIIDIAPLNIGQQPPAPNPTQKP